MGSSIRPQTSSLSLPLCKWPTRVVQTFLDPQSCYWRSFHLRQHFLLHITIIMLPLKNICTLCYSLCLRDAEGPTFKLHLHKGSRFYTGVNNLFFVLGRTPGTTRCSYSGGDHRHHRSVILDARSGQSQPHHHVCRTGSDPILSGLASSQHRWGQFMNSFCLWVESHGLG